MAKDRWEDASAYDLYMGRWSRSLANEFVTWLDIRRGAAWLEIGCGTGSLTDAICALADPAAVVACDTAPDYVRYCREHLSYQQLTVVPVPPAGYPSRAGGFDVVASSLVLNFIPSPVAALVQMRASCAPGGRVAACVWDYAEGMEFLRTFWDAAVALDSAAHPLDEGRRFPLCRPDPLRTSFEAAGLESVRIAPISVATTFASFDDFWTPFVNGPGPAPSYVASLSDTARQRLANRLRNTLGPHGLISLRARAWAASGVRSAA
jgi:SAM-dependent methyltransferase